MTVSMLALCESARPGIVSGMAMIKDLADPDRAFVEIRVAERHCEIPGMVPRLDLQTTCHFRSVTAAVLKLKKPICAWHEEQKIFKLLIPEGIPVRFCLFRNPSSKVDGEN